MNENKALEAHDALKFLYSLSLNCSIGDIQEKQVKVAFEAVHAALTELAEIKKRAEWCRTHQAWGNDIIGFIINGEKKGDQK